MARRFTYPYKHPKAKDFARLIAKQCKPLEKLYRDAQVNRETLDSLTALGLPTKGIGWVKIAGPGQVNVSEGIWAVKIECWVGAGPYSGSTQGARILIFRDMTHLIESTPNFPKAFLRFFERSPS